MNSINLVGRLTRDPATRAAGPDHTITTLRLAINRRGNDAGAVYVDVDVWENLGRTCAEYLHKGRLISIAGRLEHDEWTTDGGEKRSRHLVVANEVSFLDPPVAS